jgi:hypothetical protein
MGIRIVAALLVCATAAEAAPAGTVAVIDRPVARVDEEVIWQSELDARGTQIDPKDKPQLLDTMIDDALTVAEALREKIEVDHSEVMAAMDEIKKQNNLDDAGLDAALKTAGYTRPRYEVDLRRQLLVLRAKNQLVAPRVMISDAEIAAEAKVRGVKVQEPEVTKIRSDLRRKALDAETVKWIAELRRRAWIDKRVPKETPVKWSELTGKVQSLRITGAGDALRKDIDNIFAPTKGKALDETVGELPGKVMKLSGVAEVVVSGVQTKAGIDLLVDVKPQPTMKKLTAIEKGGKTIALGIGAPATGGALDPLRIQSLASTLRSRYVENGFFDVAVTWRADTVTGGVEVVIEVVPGTAATIGGVAFKGATVSAKTLEAQVAKYLVLGQPATSDKLDVAALTLSAYYWDLGYANVKVKSPKPTAGRNVIAFEITEGPQFRIGTIDVKGDVPATDHAKLKTLFGIKTGDLFNRTAIADGRNRVADALIAAGKRNVNVLPLTKVDLPNKKINFTLEVSASP